jgi:DNA-binding MarR family transcriptional regulator
MAQELNDQSRFLVNRSCFGLNIHRAGRTVAKKFDDAFRMLGVNHWQFSLLMTINKPDGMTVSELANALVVDRTTITANVKPLERMGLISITVGETDARSRQIQLTREGVDLLKEAFPIWERVNGEIGHVVETGKEEVLGALAAITSLHP